MKFNLKFIGRTYYKIKKSFERPQWETIWTTTAKGRRTMNGIPIGEYKEFIIIVRHARNKKRIMAYGSDGVASQSMDLCYLASEYDDLKEILHRRGIKY